MSQDYKTDFDKRLSELVAKKQRMADMVDHFKAFVLDAMDDGMHEEFDDHFEFLQRALATFIELEEEFDA